MVIGGVELALIRLVLLRLLNWAQNYFIVHFKLNGGIFLDEIFVHLIGFIITVVGVIQLGIHDVVELYTMGL